MRQGIKSTLSWQREFDGNEREGYSSRTDVVGELDGRTVPDGIHICPMMSNHQPPVLSTLEVLGATNTRRTGALPRIEYTVTVACVRAAPVFLETLLATNTPLLHRNATPHSPAQYL